MKRQALVLGLLVGVVSVTTAVADEPGVAFFEKRIRPVLVAHCYECHSAEAARNDELGGGLQLDTRAGVLQGGESGPVVVPGKPAESALVRALKYLDAEMPPEKPLPKAVIADFERWIELGVPDPREGEPVAVRRKGVDYDEGRKHWAYQPLDPGEPPKVQKGDWPAGEIDRYVLARMEEHGLAPAVDADRFAVVRRLCFDLTGLPPTPEQVARVEKVAPPDLPAAYESLVDELLASPQFGVHWARHWLDGVRFNPQLETSAYYRNWLVRAFNEDMRYEPFVQRQVAGDLLEAADVDEAAGNLVAAQMLAYNGREADFVESSLEVLGQQFLGLSLNCAKCHDHEFDAVSQEDYYALAGTLTSSTVPKNARDGVVIPGTETKLLGLFDDEPKKIGDTYLLLGGDRDRRGDLVPRRLPQVFFEDEPPRIGSETTSGRLELARWLGDLDQPLLARVAVNRVWQRLVGRGIVPTPNDFGTNGDPPTHPRLLDHLATRFVESGGSTKAVVRKIALSRTYRLSVRADAATVQQDLENDWLARAHTRRLSFEPVMDSLLAHAGELDLAIPEPVDQIKHWPTRKRKDKSFGGPRALFVRDQGRESSTFDGPSTELIVVERARSVTAPQMMYLLNGEMVRNLAPKIAKRVESTATSPDGRIDAAYRLLFARPAASEEVELGLAFVAEHGLDRYVHTLLLTNEFLYLH